MSVSLPVGSSPRKKLDQARAQRIKAEEELTELEEGDAPLTAEEATERALADWRLANADAWHQLSTYRGRRPSHVRESVVFHDATRTEDEMRARLLAGFKADGRGDGLPAADQVARIRTLRTKLNALMCDEYALTIDLIGQGYCIEHIVQLPPELLLQVAEGLGQ